MLPVYHTSHLAEVVFFGACLIWLVPEVLPSSGRRAVPGARANDRFSGLLLIGCIWLGIYACNWFGFAAPQFAIVWFRPGLFSLGILLMLAGVAFRQYAIRILGRYFTRVVMIQPGQTVVQEGPYRWIRHPSYSGALLTMFGMGLALTNWLSLAAILFFAAIGYSYRIHVEEMTLLAALGEPYRVYMQNTKRIIPFIL